jgi:hypothetical protein
VAKGFFEKLNDLKAAKPKLEKSKPKKDAKAKKGS